jgi:hypothetical protein
MEKKILKIGIFVILSIAIFVWTSVYPSIKWETDVQIDKDSNIMFIIFTSIVVVLMSIIGYRIKKNKMKITDICELCSATGSCTGHTQCPKNVFKNPQTHLVYGEVQNPNNCICKGTGFYTVAGVRMICSVHGLQMG